MLKPVEVARVLARLRLDEAELAEVDDLITWMVARNPEGPRIRRIAGYRPLSDPLELGFIQQAMAEAGLALPTELEALRFLVMDVLREIVTGRLAPDDGAYRIEAMVEGACLPHDVVSADPLLWNFCVYRRYLHAACDVDEMGWYTETCDDVLAEAQYHLGLRDRPPA